MEVGVAYGIMGGAYEGRSLFKKGRSLESWRFL